MAFDLVLRNARLASADFEAVRYEDAICWARRTCNEGRCIATTNPVHDDFGVIAGMTTASVPCFVISKQQTL